MKRKEVKNYIRLNFRVYGGTDLNTENAINNIIDVITDAWFFSWPNFAIGFIAGCAVTLIVSI